MMASAPGCHGQSTDLQTRARAPAEGMPVDIPARQRAVRSTDLESCSSGLKSRGSKINRVLKFHHSFYKGIKDLQPFTYRKSAQVHDLVLFWKFVAGRLNESCFRSQITIPQ